MRIMLACNAGMSTSLVVAKMQDAAKAHGKDYKIWAVEQGEIQNELGNFDVPPCSLSGSRDPAPKRFFP